MKQWKGFFCGVLAAVLVLGLGLSALAISGRMTIEVDPVNIQVNGATFQPKDVTGAEVPVFAYNGTTYAPLRALAEAYGLDVWYDAANNMAAVGPKGSAPAQEAAQQPTQAASQDDATWEEEGLGMSAGAPIFDLTSVIGNYMFVRDIFDDDGMGYTRHYFVAIKPATGDDGVYVDFDSSDHTGCKDFYVHNSKVTGLTVNGEGYFKVPFGPYSDYLLVPAAWSAKRPVYLNGMMDEPLTPTEATGW